MIKRLDDIAICLTCHKEFHPWKKSTRKYCSAECWHKVPKPFGETHPSWTGGRYKQDGYIRLCRRLGNGKSILEHRLVMEQMLGRPLLETETIHHKNGVRSDNRPENLELRTGNHGRGATKHCLTCTCDHSTLS